MYRAILALQKKSQGVALASTQDYLLAAGVEIGFSRALALARNMEAAEPSAPMRLLIATLKMLREEAGNDVDRQSRQLGFRTPRPRSETVEGQT